MLLALVGKHLAGSGRDNIQSSHDRKARSSKVRKNDLFSYYRKHGLMCKEGAYPQSTNQKVQKEPLLVGYTFEEGLDHN